MGKFTLVNQHNAWGRTLQMITERARYHSLATATAAMDRIFTSAEWRETLKRAAVAQRYFREKFQSASPELLEAAAQEEAIRSRNQGGRT
jgi:hypothetical protein